jgi:hypothetical protein
MNEKKKELIEKYEEKINELKNRILLDEIKLDNLKKDYIKFLNKNGIHQVHELEELDL